MNQKKKIHKKWRLTSAGKITLTVTGILVATGIVSAVSGKSDSPRETAGEIPSEPEIIRSEIPDFSQETETESETVAEETQPETVPDPFNPQFSAEPGFYADSITLELSSGTGTAIYYTTDGSTPTTESERYTEPIVIESREGEENYIANRWDTSAEPFIVEEPVDKATVIRAVAVDDDGNLSDIVTHTYFIGLNQQEDYGRAHVVSVALDEEALFGYSDGIYCKGAVYDNYGRYAEGYFIPANYTQKGRNWEREAGVEIFDSDGNSIASQEMGIRIMGGTSRNYVQKSLKLLAREEYGNKKLKCALFPDLYKQSDPTDAIKKFKSIVLRNGGDDYYGTKFRDAFIQKLVSGRAVSTQKSEPAVGFLNGEYAGVYNLQEDYSKHYIESHYGVPDDDVIMIKTEEIEEGNEEDYALFEELSDFVNSADLSDDAVYAEYCQKMDIQSLIDYFALELWIENNDWIDVGNNYRLWRSRSITNQPYQDGKWRWAVYDTEYSMGCDRHGEPEGRSRLLNALIEKRYYIGVNFFVQPLLQNAQFRSQFVKTFMDLCNSCFEPEYAVSVLNAMYQQDYAPILNQGFLRTGPDWRADSDEAMTAYTENVIAYETYFIQGRTPACIDMLTDCLSLNGTAEITVTVEQPELGAVQINSVLPDWKTASTWKGIYFTDYPITLTAIPAEGGVFQGWEGAGLSPAETKNLTITVPVTQALHLTASFK
ncbi:MAG: CotH kinase family protein [Oscillospiraceae bacterium]|nr:CotH kinase family protein [Oscillospiraceae bacterium]